MSLLDESETLLGQVTQHLKAIGRRQMKDPTGKPITLEALGIPALATAANQALAEMRAVDLSPTQRLGKPAVRTFRSRSGAGTDRLHLECLRGGQGVRHRWLCLHRQDALALLLAICVAAGIPFLGEATKQCKSVYLAFEGARNARRKAQRICRGLGTSLAEIGDQLDIIPAPSGMLNSQTAAELCERCAANGVGLVVLVTYGSALDGSIDRNAAAFSDALKQLGDCSDATGIVFVVLLHLNKKGGDSRPTLQAIDGHNSAAGAVQAAVGLYRPDVKDETLIEVSCVRHTDEDFKPILVRWVDRPFSGPTSESVRLSAKGHDVERWALVAEKVDAAATTTPAAVSKAAANETAAGRSEQRRGQQIVKYLASRADKAASLKQIKDAVTGDHTPIKNTLLALVEDGVVEQDTAVRRDPVYGIADYSPARQAALLARGIRLPQ